jgi:hypothetical protein
VRKSNSNNNWSVTVTTIGTITTGGITESTGTIVMAAARHRTVSHRHIKAVVTGTAMLKVMMAVVDTIYPTKTRRQTVQAPMTTTTTQMMMMTVMMTAMRRTGTMAATMTVAIGVIGLSPGLSPNRDRGHRPVGPLCRSEAGSLQRVEAV